MDNGIQELATKLGAEVVGTVPEYSAGAFGVAKLEHALRERLERKIRPQLTSTARPHAATGSTRRSRRR